MLWMHFCLFVKKAFRELVHKDNQVATVGVSVSTITELANLILYDTE